MAEERSLYAQDPGDPAVWEKPFSAVWVMRVTASWSPMWMAPDRVTSPNPMTWRPSPKACVPKAPRS